MASKRVIVQVQANSNSPYAVLQVRGADTPRAPFFNLRVRIQDLRNATVASPDINNAPYDTIDAELVTG